MYPSSKRQGMIAMVVLAALMLMAGNAWAQARKTSISCSASSTGDVSVEYTIKGVGSDALCVEASTTFSARCICKSNSGNCPASANKRAVPVPVSEGAVAEPRNGQISTDFTGPTVLDAPTVADCAVLDCPSGQTAILAQIVTGVVTVDVFDVFTSPDGTCDGTGTPIRSGTCTPSPATITLDAQCASRF